jgi:hypothetical protein
VEKPQNGPVQDFVAPAGEIAAARGARIGPMDERVPRALAEANGTPVVVFGVTCDEERELVAASGVVWVFGELLPDPHAGYEPVDWDDD